MFKSPLLIWSITLSIILLSYLVKFPSILIMPPHETHTLPVHKTLYIDQNMSDDEILHIAEATIEWNEVTNGQVMFDVKKLPQQNIEWSNSAIVFNVSPSFPDIILMDSATNKMTTLGYFNDEHVIPYIALVNERISEEDFTTVVMHELGHYLGLEHPNQDHKLEGIGSLMYSNIRAGSNHITDEDLKQFCQVYNCDSRKFHELPQIQQDFPSPME